MKSVMALGTQGYEILFGIIAQHAARLDMMNLKILLSPAVLATPSVARKDSSVQPLI